MARFVYIYEKFKTIADLATVSTLYNNYLQINFFSNVTMVTMIGHLQSL